MQTADEVVPRAHREIKPSPADEARFWEKVDKSGGADACWLWTAGKTKLGYGQYKAGGVMLRAHRIAWTITNGPIPHDGSYHGTCVCHRCDNPACCNPAHLFLGTHEANMRDRDMKGRGVQLKGDAHSARLHPERLSRGDAHYSRVHPERLARGDANGSRLHPERLKRGDMHPSRLHPERLRRGEVHGCAKLTAAQVVEIRDLYTAGGTTHRLLAAQFGVSKPVIGDIINRKIWKHV